MSNASETFSAAQGVAFQVERLEFVPGEHCELRGTWSGVRGRRFMRPALTVIVDGRPVRLLADLAHKPWAAEEGQPWVAAFPCELDGAEIGEAELTVAPDITIPLALPGSRPASGRRGRAGSVVATAAGARRPAAKLQPAPGRRDDQRTPASGRARTAAQSRSGGPVPETRASKTASERRQLADKQIADLQAERGRLRDELDGVRKEFDDLRQQRDRALGERGSAVAAQTRAETERGAAVAARDQALAERDTALAVRDHALAERDAATASQRQLEADREALARTNDRLQSELSDLISARRGAVLVARRTTAFPPASRRSALLLPRAIGLLVLVLVAVIALLVLHVI